MFLCCSSQGQQHGKVPPSKGPGHLPGQEWVLLIPFFSFPYSLKPKSGKGPRCQHFPSMKGRQSRRAPWTDTAGKDIFFFQGGLYLLLKFSRREKMSWSQFSVLQGRPQGPKSNRKSLLCSTLARLGQGAFPQDSEKE